MGKDLKISGRVKNRFLPFVPIMKTSILCYEFFDCTGSKRINICVGIVIVV